MKDFKDAKHAVRGVLGTAFLVGNMCTFFVPLMSTLWVKRISKKRGAKLRNFWYRHWSDFNMWAVRNILGVSVKTAGHYEIPDDAKLVIVISDHHSWGDIPVLIGSLVKKVPPRFMLKRVLTKVPVLGPSMLSLGMMPVWRGDKSSVQENWIMHIASAIKGRSKTLDRIVHHFSGISFDEWLQKQRLSIQEIHSHDIQTVREACAAMVDEGPSSILIFAPGTRWSKEKFEKAQLNNSPFASTLPPKAGGLAEVFKVLLPYIDGVVFINTVWEHEADQELVNETDPLPFRQLRTETRNFTTFISGRLPQVLMKFRWIPKEEVCEALLSCPQPNFREGWEENLTYDSVKEWLYAEWEKVDIWLTNWIHGFPRTLPNDHASPESLHIESAGNQTGTSNPKGLSLHAQHAPPYDGESAKI